MIMSEVQREDNAGICSVNRIMGYARNSGASKKDKPDMFKVCLSCRGKQMHIISAMLTFGTDE